MRQSYFANNPSTLPQISLKSLAGIAMLAGLLGVTGCQSMQTKTPAPVITTPGGTVTAPAKLDTFTINGKIGITTPATAQAPAQAGSAFYAWGQQGDRFAIELVGALGIGKTNIEYNGQTATLVSEKTGSMTASSPDELLKKATGWQVPISQLPYWISGKPAPSDSGQQVDEAGRLVAAVNGDWTANFTYEGAKILPNKINVRSDQGHKVVMTIMHQTSQ
jgi:outer membrane lipoprotein LolB